MPFNGSGVYTPPGADFPAVSGTLIQSTKFNNVVNDIATALSIVLVSDGQRAASADLPMGGFKHTNVANATLRTNYAATGQVQNQGFSWCGTAGGTANALTINPTPAIAAYAAGQMFVFKAGASPNTGATTVAVSGLATKAIQNDGAALVANDIAASKWYRVTYDGAAFQLERLNSATLLSAFLSTLLAGANAWTGVNTFVDTNFQVIGSADATKKLRFEVDGFTTGQTRIGTPPDYNHRVMSQTHGANIASAGTVNLDTATGDLVDVTGTTTITAITLADGKMAMVRFTGALTLTDGALLVLPGDANITTAAGDFALFRGYAAGVVRCASYVKANGMPVIDIHGRQVFTGSGTFNVPNGVSKVYVSQCGGGGGGSGVGGGAGQGGVTGGTTTFGALVSTTGGTGGGDVNVVIPPGTGGGSGGYPHDPSGGHGGANPFGGQVRGPTTSASGATGIKYGSGGSGASDAAVGASGGGAGNFVLLKAVSVTPESAITVTIGTGGAGGDGAGGAGGTGAAGVCIVEW